MQQRRQDKNGLIKITFGWHSSHLNTHGTYQRFLQNQPIHLHQLQAINLSTCHQHHQNISIQQKKQCLRHIIQLELFHNSKSKLIQNKVDGVVKQLVCLHSTEEIKALVYLDKGKELSMMEHPVEKNMWEQLME